MNHHRYSVSTLGSIVCFALLLSAAPALAQENDPEIEALGPQPVCDGLSGTELRICKVQSRTWKIAERQIRWQARQELRSTRLEKAINMIYQNIREGFRSPYLLDQDDRRAHLRAGGSPSSFYQNLKPALQQRIDQRRLLPQRAERVSSPPSRQAKRLLRSGKTMTVSEQKRQCKTLPPDEWKACFDTITPR
jgi:hypothetical protein